MGQAKLIKVAEVMTRLDWGGSPDILRITCRNLDPSVFDVRVISGPSEHQSKNTAAFIEELKDRYILAPTLKRDLSFIDDISALAALYRIFRRERFDVVHTHTAKAGALGRIAAKLAGVKAIVHTPHGHNLYGYFGGAFSLMVLWLERMLTSFADKIVALTALEKRDYEHYRVAGADKVTLIYQGLDPDPVSISGPHKEQVRSELGIRPGEKVVGIVARLEEVKGPGYFVRSAALIAKKMPEARFVMVGDGSLRDDICGQISSLGLSGAFIMAGWRDDIRPVMSVFDVMVLPSLNEAVGMALIEAQAQGVPVVASNVGGIPEVIDDGRTGILVPPKDPESIARAVLLLLGDDHLRADMSANAREWVKGKFEAKAMADRLAGLYREILRSKI